MKPNLLKFRNANSNFFGRTGVFKLCFGIVATMSLQFATAQVASQTPASPVVPPPSSRAVEPTVSVNSTALSPTSKRVQPTASVESTQNVIQPSSINPAQSASATNQNQNSGTSNQISSEQQSRYQAAVAECASQNSVSVADVPSSSDTNQREQTSTPPARVSDAGSPAALKNCLQARGF